MPRNCLWPEGRTRGTMAPREFERLVVQGGKKYLGCRKLRQYRDGPRSMWDMCSICLDPIVLWRVPTKDETAICEVCVQAMQKGLISSEGKKQEDYCGLE